MAKAKPSIGRVEAASVKSHSEGWSTALDIALKDVGWKPKLYKQVQVEFYANVNVENPGSIVEYAVKLIPGP